MTLIDKRTSLNKSCVWQTKLHNCRTEHSTTNPTPTTLPYNHTERERHTHTQYYVVCTLYSVYSLCTHRHIVHYNYCLSLYVLVDTFPSLSFIPPVPYVPPLPLDDSLEKQQPYTHQSRIAFTVVLLLSLARSIGVFPSPSLRSRAPVPPGKERRSEKSCGKA